MEYLQPKAATGPLVWQIDCISQVSNLVSLQRAKSVFYTAMLETAAKILVYCLPGWYFGWFSEKMILNRIYFVIWWSKWCKS